MEFVRSNQATATLTEAEWQEIHEVTLAAFAVHKNAGINMIACDITLSQLKEFIADCQIFLIKSGAHIVAYKAVKIERKGDEIYGNGRLDGVSPDAKRHGFGRLLQKDYEQWAMEQGCAYIMTDTSCKAKSAYGCHLAMGMKRWYYGHHASKNYLSIFFRKDMNETMPDVQRRMILLKSWIKVRMKYTTNGEYTWFYRIYKRLRAIIKW